jgi:hypothetical protein
MTYKETSMSPYSYSALDLPLLQLLDSSTTEQLRLSREAARRSAITQAVADRWTSSDAGRPARRSLWQRARRLVLRPRPA